MVLGTTLIKGIMLSSTTFKGYLFNNSGAMAENSWVKIKDTWFYANASGKLSKTNGKKSAVLGILLLKMELC